MLWQKCLNIRSDHGVSVVVDGVTTIQGALENGVQGEGKQVF